MIGFLVSLKLPLEQNFIAIAIAGLLGMVAVMLINHKLCASTHHIDATKEAEGQVTSIPAARAAPARG